MRMSFSRRAYVATLATAAAAVVTFCAPAVAHATGVTEFPDNGSEQSGRGGAWVARASDPLAAFYNPAGLAGQPTRLILQANVNFQKTCFTRLKATNDPTVDPDGTKPGGLYPKVCSDNGAGIDPQIAMTFKVNDRVGIGFAPLLAPSAGASSVSFPEFVATKGQFGTTYEPGPTRYMLTSANLLVLNPTLGIGAEIVNRLRVGASFQWGIASLSFSEAVAASANAVTTLANGQPAPNSFNPATDIKAVAKVHDYFIPGFTLGAIYSATDDFDIAAWYKWSDAIKATGDIQTTTSYYTGAVASGKSTGGAVGNTALANCGITGTATPCGSGNNVHLQVNEPMEAKVGFRYHKRRNDVPYNEHVRDPMAQDVFDIEADLTWANDSTFQNLQVRLPGNATGDGILPINGIPGTFAPPNADVLHQFRDVFGVRLGGDYNVLRDQLAIRAGAFLQSSAQNAQYQNVDFAGSLNGGLALGGTYRIHLSKEKANAIEVSLGYEHVFYLDETNNGPNGLEATAGTPCLGTATQLPATNTCGTANGQVRYRTAWPINLGTITNSVNVLNVGLGYKF
jgi:long-subunit fatty acid transport protein